MAAAATLRLERRAISFLPEQWKRRPELAVTWRALHEARIRHEMTPSRQDLALLVGLSVFFGMLGGLGVPLWGLAMAAAALAGVWSQAALERRARVGAVIARRAGLEALEPNAALRRLHSLSAFAAWFSWLMVARLLGELVRRSVA